MVLASVLKHSGISTGTLPVYEDTNPGEGGEDTNRGEPSKKTTTPPWLGVLTNHEFKRGAILDSVFKTFGQ